MDLSVVISQANADWVYDPQRDQIHFVTRAGRFLDWSVTAQQFVGDLAIGGTPTAVAITPDGAFALVGHAEAIEGGAFAAVTRVNLATRAIDTIRIAIQEERGVYDIAVDADGTALLTTWSNFSGRETPFRAFNASAATPSVQVVRWFPRTLCATS
jgi:hypothetical protein